MLIENVLAGDRLTAGQTPFSTEEVFNLNGILHTAKAGLDGGRQWQRGTAFCWRSCCKT